jgi:histidyl-tRNA synthetase
MMQKQSSATLTSRVDIYCAARGEEAEAQALAITQQLRQAGLAVEVDLSGSAFGKQLKRADRSGAPLALILGEEEALNHTVQLKWLTSAEQTTLSQSELFDQLSVIKEKIMLSNPTKRI